MAVLRIPVQLAGELLLRFLQGRLTTLKRSLPHNVVLKRVSILQQPWALHFELEGEGLPGNMELEIGEETYEGVTSMTVGVRTQIGGENNVVG